MSADLYSVLQKFQIHAILSARSKPRRSEHSLIYYLLGQGSVFGIATRHGMDGPVIESRWGARFFAPVQSCLDTHPNFLYNGYRLILGGKTVGTWRWPPAPSIAEVIERVELYLYSPPLGLRGLFWAVFTSTFTTGWKWGIKPQQINTSLKKTLGNLTLGDIIQLFIIKQCLSFRTTPLQLC